MNPEQRITALESKNAEIMAKLATLGFHHHSGTDSDKVFYRDLEQSKLWIRHTLTGTTAATAANYGPFFIVPVACVLTGFKEVHETIGSDGSAVTVTLEKLTGATAPDSGIAMLTAALSLKATANTVQTGTIVPSLVTRNLKAVDRLGLKDAGTLTSVAGVTVLVELTIV